MTHTDLPQLIVRVDAPERVGIDRLLAAVAVNRVRRPDRPAVVVDLGTAITVDLIAADGAFEGGAILPGIAMAARAMAEQTDALPQSRLAELRAAPPVVGKSTLAAIDSGLFWGAIGAVRELVTRYATTLDRDRSEMAAGVQPSGCRRQAQAGTPTTACGIKDAPDLFLTGGAAPQVADLLSEDGLSVRHLPNLVLSGIASAAQTGAKTWGEFDRSL